MSVVLDTSAVLAFLYKEDGHEEVRPLLPEGRVSTANWAEILQKIAFHGGDSNRQGALLQILGLSVEPLTVADAALAASFYPLSRGTGLSLGDRCCLALAYRLRLPAVTADKAWSAVDVGVDVRQIR